MKKLEINKFKGKVAITEQTRDVITGTDIFKELLRKLEETRNQ